MNKRILFTMITVLIILAYIYSLLTFWPYLTKTKNDAENSQKMKRQELKRINDNLKSNPSTFVITYQPEFDKEYTKKSSLALSGDKILLKYNGNALEIRPFILFSNQERYLIANEFDFSVKENGFYRKWEVIIKNVSSFLNSSLCNKKEMLIGFDLIGKDVKRYGDYSFVWNSILIDFYDLVEHNFEVFIINDSRVLIGNLTLNIINDSIFLDPTDQLLPSSNHKAYKGTTDNQDNPFLATTEMSYSYINKSDNLRDSSSISHSLTLSCSVSGTCSCSSGVVCEQNSDCVSSSTCTVSCPGMSNAKNITIACSPIPTGCICSYSLFCGGGTCSCISSGRCSYACDPGYYDCDNSASTGCEATSACYRYAFHRFTFNLSDYQINDIEELKYCWEGYHTTADNVSVSANLQWYNASSGSWIYDKAISTSEATYCTVLTGNNITNFINSTSKIAQFAVKLRMSKQANRGIYLYTDFVNLTVTYRERIPPQYSLNSTNSTLAGSAVLHSLFWQDNVGLSGFIFSFDNCTGIFVNDSWVAFSGNPQSAWSNVTKTINSTVGCIIKWRVFANDTSNNWNVSEIFSYVTTTLDNIPPQYSLNSTNSTLAGSAVLHSLFWQDEYGLSYAIFSFDNCTRNFQNISTIQLTGKQAWSNFTVVINETEGCIIRWCVYANDTSNNWNNSSCENPFSYVTAPFPRITVISPENKTYNSSFFWANISLNKPGSIALYSFDNQPNQTLIKFNDTYFYKKIYSTKGNHKIIFYANDTEGIMVNSSEIYFYLNVTGYTTIELSIKKAWWNDSILVYGEARDLEGGGIKDSFVEVMIGGKRCENYTDSNGIWSCKINAPNEIGNHLLSIDVGGIKNFTYLKVSPFYGKEEKNVEKRIYEVPVLIQDKNGKIKTVWLRFTSY